MITTDFGTAAGFAAPFEEEYTKMSGTLGKIVAANGALTDANAKASEDRSQAAQMVTMIAALATLLIAGALGVWLFYVQHTFAGAYWARKENWDAGQAAVVGSSYFDLPRVLHWFTGNIGFHHIHHLSSRIPNYNLERCHHSNPLFSEVKPITMLTSLRSMSLRLWDEQQKKLVGYKRLREVRREQKLARDQAAQAEAEQADAAASMSQQGM